MRKQQRKFESSRIRSRQEELRSLKLDQLGPDESGLKRRERKKRARAAIQSIVPRPPKPPAPRVGPVRRPRVPRGTRDLAGEIAFRKQRRETYLTNLMGDFSIPRPAKTANLKTKTTDNPGGVPTFEKDLLGSPTGQSGQAAHHMVPFNVLAKRYRETVTKGDAKGLHNVLSWSGKHEGDTSDLYRKNFAVMSGGINQEDRREGRARESERLSGWGVKPATARKVIDGLERSALDRERKSRLLGLGRSKEFAWAKHNIFMGPLPEDRTLKDEGGTFRPKKDDPGSDAVDARHLPSGELSEGSKFAQRIFDHGFGGESGPSLREFEKGKQRATLEHEQHGKTHDPAHWGKERQLTNQKELDAHARKIQEAEDNLAMWAKTPNKKGVAGKVRRKKEVLRQLRASQPSKKYDKELYVKKPIPEIS